MTTPRVANEKRWYPRYPTRRSIRTNMAYPFRVGHVYISSPSRNWDGLVDVFIWETSHFLQGKKIKRLRGSVVVYATSYSRIAQGTDSGCPKGEGQDMWPESQTNMQLDAEIGGNGRSQMKTNAPLFNTTGTTRLIRQPPGTGAGHWHAAQGSVFAPEAWPYQL